MKNTSLLLKHLLTILLLSTVWLAGKAQSWQILSDQTEIRFSGTGAEGTFSGLTGTIIFDPEDPKGGNFDVQLSAGTIDTGNKTKDKHARGKNWFDIEKYPSATFTSSDMRQMDDQWEVDGVIEIHGIQKAITIPFTFQEKADRGIFKGDFSLDRNDFEIYGPFFGFVVGDEFRVELVVSTKRMGE